MSSNGIRYSDRRVIVILREMKQTEKLYLKAQHDHMHCTGVIASELARVDAEYQKAHMAELRLELWRNQYTPVYVL